jgi:hypothetical protein
MKLYSFFVGPIQLVEKLNWRLLIFISCLAMWFYFKLRGNSNLNKINRNIIISFYVVPFLVFSCQLSFSQSIERHLTATTGSYSSFPDLQVQWSLGEVVMDDMPISGTHLTQGFQQRTCVSPPIVFAPAVTQLCYYESPLLLDFAQPSGGQWSGSGIILQNQQPYFSPAFATVGSNVLYYRYTDPVLGCVGIDSIALIVNACTGVASDHALPDLHIYPVPADRYLEVSGYVLPEYVEVINLSGQRQRLPTGSNRIPTESLPNGVYYLSLPELVLPFTVLHP